MDFKLLLGWEAIRVSKGKDIVISLDWEGVPFGLYLGEKFYRRALDGRIQEKWREKRGGRIVRMRRFLSRDEREAIIDKTSDILFLARGALSSKSIIFDGIKREAIDEVSEIFLTFRERMQRSESAFKRVYQHLGILPPDQYLSLVLQATEGCHWNRCTFCGFYKKTPFRIKDEQEFREHIRRVKDFFGRGLRLRKTIFLSEANALITTWNTLKAQIKSLFKEFHISKNPLKGRELRRWKRLGDLHFEGVYSFMDASTGNRLGEDKLYWLRKNGLRRVYIGLETGSEEIYRLLDKPGSIGDALDSVNSIKRAGINVGVVVLLGIGGKKLSSVHLKETVKILERMHLGRGDFIYLSPYQEVEGTKLPIIFERMGLLKMGLEDLEREKEAFLKALKALPFAKGVPLISTYNIEEFIY